MFWKRSRSPRRPAVPPYHWPKSFRPQLEVLLARVVPAVTFTFDAATGLLAVAGDGASDAIVVRTDPASGEVLANNLATGASLTTLNALSVNGNGGNDVIDLSQLNVSFLDTDPTVLGGAGNDTITGSARQDRIDGGADNDRIDGGAGGDAIEGGTGDDTVRGNTGSDAMAGGDGADLLVEAGNASFTLNATQLLGGPVFGGDTQGGFEAADLTGGIDNNVINAAAFGGPVTLSGGAGNDSLSGSQFADSINGGQGDDAITGLGGNDTLQGAGGTNTLNGGVGLDTAREVPTAAPIIWTLTNTALSTTGISDSLSLIERADLIGTPGNDTFNLTGFTGDADLDGAAGLDRVVADVASNATLRNTELSRGGTSEVALASIESAILAGDDGANIINAEEFSGQATLLGAGGNDTLRGGSGTNVIAGNGGDDTITGGLGNDILSGGRITNFSIPFFGNVIVLDDVFGGNDLFDEDVAGSASLTNTSFTGAGVDTLFGFERAVITGGDGANAINATDFTRPVTLNGGGGNDLLTGGSDSDFLSGGQGDDRLDGNDGSDTLNGGADVDTVDEEKNANFTLTDTSLFVSGFGTDSLVNVEQANLRGGDGDNDLNAVSFTGRVTLDGGGGNDELVGGLSDDQLLGNSGNDTLLGNGGNDVLHGGTGDDSLFGGTGDDTLTGSFGNDTIQGSSGSDLLNEGFSSANDKTITIDSDSMTVIDGTGNFTDTHSGLDRANISTLSGDNRVSLNGFTGPATVTGGSGRDTLSGGNGNDVLNGGANIDTLFLAANGSVDLVDGSVTAPGEGTDALLGIETAEIAGTNLFPIPDLFDATGFTGDVTLRGGAGNDTLLGGAGDDSFDGGSGNDRLEGNDGADAFVDGNGLDSMSGGNGNDIFNLTADNFDDFIDGGADEDGIVVHGTSGDDVIRVRRRVGPNGPEAIIEVNGVSRALSYRNGETVTVFADGGDDLVVMDASAATWKAIFHGGAGDDLLVGSDREDYLSGGAGDDTMRGGGADDTLVGGAGKDEYHGEAGADFIHARDGHVDWIYVDASDFVLSDKKDKVRRV
jgi:Ca2+-binding RTX toxin-like protein